MSKIHLQGELGEKYGTTHNIKVSSVGEAIRALDANFPGFRNAIKRDGEYAIFRDDKNIGESELAIERKGSDWTFIPVPAGAGGDNRSIIMTVIGVALIAVAYVYGGPAAGVAMTKGWGMVMSVGISLTLTGVAGMLTPQPSLSSYDYADRERPEEKPSYLYNGPTNKTQGGHAIPTVYGEMFVGSTVISAGMRLEELI